MPDAARSQHPKLLEEVRQVLRVYHYSIHTERSYVEWMVSRWLLLVLTLGWALVPAMVPAQAAEMKRAESPPPRADPPTVGQQSADLADVVEGILTRTNAFRHQEGRPPVAANPQLTASAQDFAAFMARTGQLSHTADGQTPEDRAKAHGYDPCLIAENIASQYSSAGFTTEALIEGFFQGWQQSPDHRRNLLEPAATETGIGVARSEQTGAYYAVQLFGRPKSQQIEFHVTNTTDQAIPYAIDGKMVTLPPQATYIHQQCRPPEVTFHWPGTQENQTVHPNHGERYTIMRGEAGDFRIEPR
jgi:uncharacterized protein YkwD